ncbi:3891_t:CDS:2 [Rhizophagus irregularis]|nr:3891_t:CDS:2 [Rhizophagus irregularis]
MNSLVVLYRILRKFYRELECIEKFFLCTYIIDMATYCFLFIGSLILTGHFEIDFLFILILGFPIISGIIMFYGKTVYHGLAFLGVHSFPVFGGIAYFYTQYFNCRDHTLKCDASPTFYARNFIQALLLYFDMASFCKQFKSLAKLDSTLQCFQYNTEICTFLLYACLCWIVLALSTWNTIRCHKNFGKNMSDYITYEPTPPEFESGRKLVKRESSVPEHSHIV